MFHDAYVAEFIAKSRLLTVLYFSVKSLRLSAHRYERATIFVSNVPKGRTLGFIAGGREDRKKNALQTTILRMTRGLWTVNSKSKPWLYFMLCSIPRVITCKQKMCSLRVKKTRFRNCVCWFSCNRREHPDAMRVWGDRNSPDRTSLRGRSLKGKRAEELRHKETGWVRASIMFSRSLMAWIVSIVPTTPASGASSPPPSPA